LIFKKYKEHSDLKKTPTFEMPEGYNERFLIFV